MQYLVSLTGRALGDMELIYEFVQADSSERAFAWFNDLSEAIYSLERYPGRGAVRRKRFVERFKSSMTSSRWFCLAWFLRFWVLAESREFE